jgi:glycosyltransferase involved in cell wall biosynthesis
VHDVEEASARSNPLFSLVTATFNAGSLLDRTIESVRRQTCQDFEWIVIDGGSRDDSVERIRAAGSLVTRWVSEPDEGIADAWNKALSLATGAHAIVLNAGDTHDPDCLSTLSLHCNERQIVCAHARLLTEDGRNAGVFRARPAKLSRGMYLPHVCCAVPMDHYRNLGLYRKIPLAMDFDWFLRYYRRFGHAGFQVVDAILGTYYLGGASDRNYLQSFKASERVMIENGANAWLARAQCLSSSLKHTIKRRMLSHRPW